MKEFPMRRSSQKQEVSGYSDESDYLHGKQQRNKVFRVCFLDIRDKRIKQVQGFSVDSSFVLEFGLDLGFRFFSKEY